MTKKNLLEKYLHARPGKRIARKEEGNTLVLIAAITMGLIVALIFFCLNYTRLLGSNAEQKKAIDAAALAAAADMSSIVIDTPEMGYVSLSDQAPVGKVTKAGDQYFLPIRGINTIIGTARLDAIIADKMPNTSVMSVLAQNDLAAAKSVITQLTTVLQKSLTASGSPLAKDRDGNPVNVYADAQNAYTANLIRMTGSSSYVPNSMQLTLGSLDIPSDTNIPIPQPTNIASIPANLVQGNNYKAFVNIPYKGVNYVFGGIGDTARLVDLGHFVASNPNVAYQVPTIVKAECDQIIKTSSSPNGAKFHTASCAQASSTFDPKPAPGAIAIEFPDGQVPEFQKPGDLLTKLPSVAATVQTSSGGDYPVTASGMSSTPDPWPPNVNSHSIRDAWEVTLYDWVRRAGTKANITAVLNMQTSAFGPPPPDVDWYAELSNTPPLTNITSTFSPAGKLKVPMGTMHAYKWDPNGMVQYKQTTTVAYPYEVVSENQLYAEVAGIDNGAFTSTVPTLDFKEIKVPMPSGIKGKKGAVSGSIHAEVTFLPYFDMYVRDQCRVNGLQKGGKHGGEPLNDALVAFDLNSNARSEIAANIVRGGLDYGASGSGAGGYDSGFVSPTPPPPNGVGNGQGSPPILSAQSDFGDNPTARAKNFSYPPPYVQYELGQSAGEVRKSYQKTALTGSIRFRRQVQISGNMSLAVGGPTSSEPTDIGYLAGRRGINGGIVYTVNDPADPLKIFPDLDIADDFKEK
ncbi:MAG: hypothetical protein EKK48_01045 [Candidatus Melainabacteria bacterium]|nr:MAG: hypothetical protein EKK48_01045 [Candidatus Melainabacteria bacterium]